MCLRLSDLCSAQHCVLVFMSVYILGVRLLLPQKSSSWAQVMSQTIQSHLTQSHISDPTQSETQKLYQDWNIPLCLRLFGSEAAAVSHLVPAAKWGMRTSQMENHIDSQELKRPRGSEATFIQTKARRDLFVSHQVQMSWKGQSGGAFRDLSRTVTPEDRGEEKNVK